MEFLILCPMPKVSKKGKSMPSSPIRRLAPYAEAAVKKGVHIYHLNIGQPDIPTPKEFWDAVKQIDVDVLAYSPSGGYIELREKYAEYFREQCHLKQITSDDVLITTGASEGLFFTILSLFDEGDELIIQEPLYANYIGYSKSGNVKIKAITTNFEDGFKLPSIDEFERNITERTKAILICNPSNPTGYNYSKEELERLKDIALKHGLFIISDEVYRVFNYSDEEHISMLSFPEIEQHVVLVDSLSKKYSVCGARIGAVVSKNKEVLETVLKFAQQRLSPPTVEQLGAISLFDVDQQYFLGVRDEYIERRDVLVNALNAVDGVRCHTPMGAFYCMVQLPVIDTEHFCQWILEDFSYEGDTVMMAPGSGFYSTEGLGRDEVRMAYVLEKSLLKKAVKCLEEGLKEYKNKYPKLCKK